MKNLTQATYERLRRQLNTDPAGDRWDAGPRIAHQDVRDVLEAYESALQLLDQLIETMHRPADSEAQSVALDEAEAFLFLDSGEPRVHLEGA